LEDYIALPDLIGLDSWITVALTDCIASLDWTTSLPDFIAIGLPQKIGLNFLDWIVIDCIGLHCQIARLDWIIIDWIGLSLIGLHCLIGLDYH
jgi:hypothetical protein